MALVALLAIQPAAGASAYDEAVAARRSGNSQLAAAILEDLVRKEPRNSDAWVQYGFALKDLGKTTQAKAAFREALRLAPDYQDARDGLRLLDQANTGPSAILALDAGQTMVKGQSDWREIRGTASLPVTDAATVSGSIEHTRRFGQHDVYGEARIDLKARDRSTIYLFVGGTPRADYRPIWQIGGGGSRVLASGPNPLVLTLDLRIARYASNGSATYTITPGMVKYAGGGKLWFTGQWINVITDGRWLSGGLGRVDISTSKSGRVFLGYANAPDLSVGQVIRTTSIFAGAALTIGRNVDWRMSVAQDDPTVGPARTTLSSGLSIKLR